MLVVSGKITVITSPQHNLHKHPRMDHTITLYFSDSRHSAVPSWVCSGQSNMAYPLGGHMAVNNSRIEVADMANYPYIRLFQMGNKASRTVWRQQTYHPLHHSNLAISLVHSHEHIFWRMATIKHEIFLITHHCTILIHISHHSTKLKFPHTIMTTSHKSRPQ